MTIRQSRIYITVVITTMFNEITVGNRQVLDVVMDMDFQEKRTQIIADYSEEQLFPITGFYDVFDGGLGYYLKIRQVLFAGLSDRPEIRFQAIPSFSPEHVLNIEFDRNSNKYYMNYHICEPMLWRNLENPEKVKVNKFRTEIDKASVALVKSLFDEAIIQARYPEIYKKDDCEFVVMADGTRYLFTLGWPGYPLRSGYTRSPSEGTKMKKLVDIGYELIELAVSNKETVTIDDKLQMKIEKLIEEIKTSGE